MRSNIIKTSPRNQERHLSFHEWHAEDMEEKDYFQINWRSSFRYTALLDFTKMIVDVKYNQGSSQKSGMSSQLPWRMCRRHLDGYGLMLITKSFLFFLWNTIKIYVTGGLYEQRDYFYFNYLMQKTTLQIKPSTHNCYVLRVCYHPEKICSRSPGQFDDVNLGNWAIK